MHHQKKIIISRLFGSDQKMVRFLFESTTRPVLRERPAILLNESWELPSEQQIQVMAALDIWNSGGNVFLWQILNGLSEQKLARVLLALAECRRLRFSSSAFTQMQSKSHE